ncbi:hypothetical protein MFLAVUS_000559 [Mucor flavus]|uniref:Uncharacterized protein n=1 Tax=Mucor flavus TaxID=439312 RepID=A0ABP9YK14_9FUNG
MKDIVPYAVFENRGVVLNHDNETVTIAPDVPLEENPECIAYTARIHDYCSYYIIYDKVQVLNETQLHCYIKCLPVGSSAITTFPTFVITFTAIIFVLLLSSKRSH